MQIDAGQLPGATEEGSVAKGTPTKPSTKGGSPSPKPATVSKSGRGGRVAAPAAAARPLLQDAKPAAAPTRKFEAADAIDLGFTSYGGGRKQEEDWDIEDWDGEGWDEMEEEWGEENYDEPEWESGEAGGEAGLGSGEAGLACKVVAATAQIAKQAAAANGKMYRESKCDKDYADRIERTHRTRINMDTHYDPSSGGELKLSTGQKSVVKEVHKGEAKGMERHKGKEDRATCEQVLPVRCPGPLVGGRHGSRTDPAGR